MMASSLNKEVKKYMDALRSMAAASKNLGDCFHDLYEPEWAGQADVSQLLSELCQCHSDLLETLQLQLSDPVMAYFSHFSDIKTKISKQERKVVDYDRRKRHLEQLRKEKQTKSKVNDAKLAQAETEFEEARHVYDSLTNELYEELPTFYDSRIPFYAAIFQSLYVAEAAFHSSVATLKTQLNDLMDVAALDAASHVHSTRKPRVQRHPVTALAMSLEDDTGEHEEEQAVAEHSEDAYHDLGNTEEQESSTAEVEEKQEPSKDVVEEEQKSSKDTVKENQKASKDTIEEKSEESEKKVKPVIPKRRDSVKKTAELAKMAGPVRPAP
jgi:amphiphysin